MAIPLRSQPLVQIPEACPQILPVLLLGDPIHPHRRALPGTVVGALQGRHIDEMGQRVEYSFGFVLRSFRYLPKFR
jgi:hypothetical protein